jgi:hypothetical protein
VENILYSLATGHFYGSTGVAFTQIGYRDDAVQVRLASPALIRFVGPGGVALSEKKGQEAAFQPSGEAYVRVEAQSDEGQWAWSQPFWRLSD